LKIRKVAKPEIKSAVEEVGQILGLTEYLDRRPADLSGGQRQRVAMGRAIVRRPKVFLFDEPLSNLDAKLRTQMRAEIKRLHQRLGATSIYVTHDQVEAMTLADRIVVMSDGRIEQVGTPMELFLNPKSVFVASFLGAPPMNMIKATVAKGDTGPVAMLDALQDQIGKTITVGIRPEFVEIADEGTPDRIHIGMDLIETLGSEALLHATLGGEPFVLRTETLGKHNALGGVNGFTIRPDLIRIFDGETGEALPGQEVAA
jgi:multiple sugar transport system ATP-binding protein